MHINLSGATSSCCGVFSENRSRATDEDVKRVFNPAEMPKYVCANDATGEQKAI